MVTAKPKMLSGTVDKAGLVCAAAAFAAYGKTLWAGFVYDDA